MKMYRYQLRYIGAPYGDGEYEVVKTAMSLSGLKNLFKLKRENPKFYGSNSVIVDLKINDPMNPRKIVERPE
jgi:hypothetical protein